MRFTTYPGSSLVSGYCSEPWSSGLGWLWFSGGGLELDGYCHHIWSVWWPTGRSKYACIILYYVYISFFSATKNKSIHDEVLTRLQTPPSARERVWVALALLFSHKPIISAVLLYSLSECSSMILHSNIHTGTQWVHGPYQRFKSKDLSLSYILATVTVYTQRCLVFKM